MVEINKNKNVWLRIRNRFAEQLGRGQFPDLYGLFCVNLN